MRVLPSGCYELQQDLCPLGQLCVSRHEGLMRYSRYDLEELLGVVFFLPLSLSHSYLELGTGGVTLIIISGLGVFYVHFFSRLMSEYIYFYFQ